VKRNRKLIFFLSFVYGRKRHSISNFYAASITLAAQPSTQSADVRLEFMKVFFRNSDRRAGLSALVMIVTLLAIGALAKLDAATPLFHLAR
jgi:hypothetical protein